MDYRDLPYDAEIEYLESTGTQYINTGIYPNPLTDGFAYKINFINNLSGIRTIASTRGVWNSSSICFGVNGNFVNRYFGIFNNYRSGQNPIKSLGNTNVFNEITVINKGDYDGTKFTLEVTSPLYGSEDVVFTNPYKNIAQYPFVICASNNENSISERSHIQVAYFKLLTLDTPIFDAIPVRVGQTGYLYDKVSGKLFGNAGTGSFILGPDVAPGRYANEIAFLESTGSQYIDTGVVGSSDLSVVLKCYYPASSSSLPNTGTILGSRVANFDNQYGILHTYIANFRYGNSNSQGWANPTSKVLIFDNTESHEALKVYDTDNNLITTLTAPVATFNNNLNIVLFGLNNNGTIGGTSNRIYSLKMYEGTTLVRDYIPVEYNNIGYMYDKVSGEFFANQGTGKFVLGHRAPRFDGKACARSYIRRELMMEHYVGKAPGGYEWCDYIQNTSSAYINTGCYADGTTKVEMVMENVANTSFRGIIGTRRSGNPTWGLDQHASAGTTAYFNYGNTYSGVGTIAIGSKTTILINANVLKRNGTTYTLSGTWSGGALSNPIYVFREYSGATSCALMKLYSLKITIGGVLLRDYVPIKRLSDNKYGLWDKVNKNFVTSASSSNFTGGND